MSVTKGENDNDVNKNHNILQRKISNSNTQYINFITVQKTWNASHTLLKDYLLLSSINNVQPSNGEQLSQWMWYGSAKLLLHHSIYYRDTNYSP